MNTVQTTELKYLVPCYQKHFKSECKSKCHNFSKCFLIEKELGE